MDWNVYGFQVVAFGDHQPAVLLQVVIRMACEMYKGIDIIAAEKNQNDLFVYDLVIGGELKEMDRFMGSKTDENEHEQCSGTMAQIMEKRGLHLKAMQRDGEWGARRRKVRAVGWCCAGSWLEERGIQVLL